MKLLNELLAAIDRKDLKTVKPLLMEHPYLFHFDCPQGWPVIHRCIDDPVNASCLDLALAKQFVSHGGDVNQKAGGGVSLLFLATLHYESQDIAEYLVACGAQMSGFERAVVSLYRDGDKARAKTLVLKLVDEDPQLLRQGDYAGMTLLHHAIRHYKFDLVPLLLERGADPNAISYSGQTPLFLCGRLDDKPQATCRKVLLKNGARYTPSEELAELIFDGKDDELTARFEANPALRNAWVTWGEGGSFLHLAAWFCKTPKVVEYLLSRKLNPNIPDGEGRTPLFRACDRSADYRSASIPILDTLVRHGANINHRDDKGRTPLHQAASESWDEPARKLIELGAELNAEDEDGWTPLDVVRDRQWLDELSRWMKSKGAVRGKKKR